MKNELKGFEKVFAFTLSHQMGKNSFKSVTASVAILCILIPAMAMMGIEYFSNDADSGAPVDNGVHEEMQAPVDISSLERIFVVDTSSGEQDLGKGKFSAKDFHTFDFAMAAQQTGVDLSHVKFIEYGKNLDKALADSRGTKDTLILAVKLQGSDYILNLLIPQESGLNEDIAGAASTAFDAYLQMQLAQLNGPAETKDTEDLSGKDAVKDGLGAFLPYLNIMLIYFFVLLYGQGVSQSVVLEKSSKLMDVFLISVKPSAMILGKMTAICFAGVFQLFLWIFSLIGGFLIGYFGVKALNPETDMLLVQLMGDVGKMTSGMFSVGGFLLALLIILAGMLLYCALGAIGGALAGKQEDLASTNILFTLILITSFLACLYGGGIGGKDPQQWLYWIPFTSIMVAPSGALLGTISPVKSLGILLLVMAAALLFTIAAGRIYKNMAMYKGDLPKPRQILKMLK